MARPSKYETHVAPRLEEIKDWCRNGATDEEIAKRLGISIASFYNFKNQFLEFLEALKETKEIVDAQVENALLKRALGYEYKEVTKKVVDGELKVTKVITKQVVPDTTAQIFWLKNREPSKWRDKLQVEAGISNENKELMREYLNSVKKE